MRTYMEKAVDAARAGRSVMVSPEWLMATLDAMKPFADMWREGDEVREDSEILIKRGTASDADFITSTDIRHIGRAYRKAQTPAP